jgi:hypothetical protein
VITRSSAAAGAGILVLPFGAGLIAFHILVQMVRDATHLVRGTVPVADAPRVH